MRRILKFFVIVLMALSIAPALQSCEDDDEYLWGTPDWFNGKEFTADAQPWQYNSYWVLHFYRNGTFSVTPVDRNGNEMYDIADYEGRWSVDYNTCRLYVTYYGYSSSSIWNFQWWDEVDSYSGYYPYMEIYTSPGSGELDNLTFYPGF